MRLRLFPALAIALTLMATAGCAASKASSASTAAVSDASPAADAPASPTAKYPIYPGAIRGVPPGTKPGTDLTYWTHDSYEKVKAWYDKQPPGFWTIVRIEDKTWISIHPDL